MADGRTPSQIVMRSGSDYLLRGDLDRAKSVFNTGLKFDFYNASLHALNALTYQQGFARGNPDDLNLAIAGYRVALMLDPEMASIGYREISRLQFAARDYAAAKVSAAKSIEANGKSSDALGLLAKAAMLSGDLDTANWALESLQAGAGVSPGFIRLSALLAALTGKSELAQAQVIRYEGAIDDPASATYLKERVNELLAGWTASHKETTGAQGDTAAKVPGTVDMSPASGGGDVAGGSTPQATGDSKEPSGSQWFRCDTAPAMPNYQQIRVGEVDTDESIMAEVLPAPCPGEQPAQGLFAVTLVGTTESRSRNIGINLLDGLSGIWTLSNNYLYTKISGEPSTYSLQRTNNLVLSNAIGSTGEDVLRYSLNIAGSAYSRSEVILRPTLSAVDRVPAVLFVGSTYTLGIGGNDGSSAEIEDHSTGISLSITPTFMAEDDVLVSIRVTRGAIVPNYVSESVLLQQNRSVLTGSAILSAGDTFILTGISEDEVSRDQNGVPGLQDIPVLRQLFKSSLETKTNVTLLALITYLRDPAEKLRFMGRDFAQRSDLAKSGRSADLVGFAGRNSFHLESLKAATFTPSRRLSRKDLVEPNVNEDRALKEKVDQLLSYGNDL